MKTQIIKLIPYNMGLVYHKSGLLQLKSPRVGAKELLFPANTDIPYRVKNGEIIIQHPIVVENRLIVNSDYLLKVKETDIKTITKLFETNSPTINAFEIEII